MVTQEQSKVIKETENPFGEDEEEEDDRPGSPGPSKGHSRTSSQSNSLAKQTYTGYETKKKKDKKSKKSKPFNLAAEQDKMKACIADANIAATNLMNMLQTINREKERISENQIAVLRFEACKDLRRKILRYIHNVESEQWLGSLLNANDALVTALMTFEQLDCSIDADSDSDDELAAQAHMYRSTFSNCHFSLSFFPEKEKKMKKDWNHRQFANKSVQWRQRKPKEKNRVHPPAPRPRPWPV